MEEGNRTPASPFRYSKDQLRFPTALLKDGFDAGIQKLRQAVEALEELEHLPVEQSPGTSLFSQFLYGLQTRLPGELWLGEETEDEEDGATEPADHRTVLLELLDVLESEHAVRDSLTALCAKLDCGDYREIFTLLEQVREKVEGFTGVGGATILGTERHFAHCGARTPLSEILVVLDAAAHCFYGVIDLINSSLNFAYAVCRFEKVRCDALRTNGTHIETEQQAVS